MHNKLLILQKCFILEEDKTYEFHRNIETDTFITFLSFKSEINNLLMSLDRLCLMFT